MKSNPLFRTYFPIGLCIAICLVTACNEEEALPYQPVEPTLPENVYDYQHQHIFDFGAPNAESIDNHTATLGRVLFYDTKLSLNNRVACGSCHQQDKAFSDGEVFSVGFEFRKTSRNTPAIINAYNQFSYFWDGREAVLRDMVLKPIENHVEMGMESIESLTQKLATTSYYPGLFEDAFGSTDITAERIGIAMAHFLCALSTHDAKIDRAWETEFSDFTPEERQGWQLFHEKANCINCHGGQDFRGYFSDQAANIGLDMEYDDQGMGEGMFKVPSLRNIALTAPYMHDGRFSSLKEVVAHYNDGIKNHPNLDWRLQSTGEPQRLQLTDQEQNALVAFLHTLTDESMLTDPRFSNPFE